MKLYRETVHTPAGTTSHRLYEYGPFTITTWPGPKFRGIAAVRQYKGKTTALTRRQAAALLATIRTLRQYAP
jgi:hypothetical protein